MCLCAKWQNIFFKFCTFIWWFISWKQRWLWPSQKFKLLNTVLFILKKIVTRLVIQMLKKFAFVSNKLNSNYLKSVTLTFVYENSHMNFIWLSHIYWKTNYVHYLKPFFFTVHWWNVFDRNVVKLVKFHLSRLFVKVNYWVM